MEENDKPNIFVFNENTDDKGNTYKNAYSNKETSCIICINGKNTLVRGKLKLFARKGKSGFGEELGVVFHITEKHEEYPSSSSQEVVEMYLPLPIGIDFLEKTIKHLKEED